MVVALLAWRAKARMCPSLGLSEEEARRASALTSRFDVEAATAVRFLRARKGDVDAAADMLEASLAWRASALPIDVDVVREEILKDKIVTLPERDKQGRLVVLIRANRLGKHTYEDLAVAEKAAVFMMEYLERSVLGPLEKLAVLFSRLPPNHAPDLDWTRAVASTLQSNYPERLAVLYVAPVHLAFRAVWNVAKFFFDPVTRAKVHLRRDASAFADLLADDALPLELGGTDPRPLTAADTVR